MAEHPITPTPELVRQWATANGTTYEDLSALCQSVATRAARWGADTELEACINWMRTMGYWGDDGVAISRLRAARRPKPPSLKERIATAIAHGDTSIALALLDQVLPE